MLRVMGSLLAAVITLWLVNGLEGIAQAHARRAVMQMPNPAPAAEEMGVKSQIVKKTTRLLASAIREGGKYASWVVGKLDAKAARTFRKYAKRIADELDEIAKIPDLTTRIVKEKLYYFLNTTLGLSGGTSLSIADAVKAVIDFLVF